MGFWANVSETRLDNSEVRIGVLHRVSAASMKMTCGKHRRCVLWLTLRDRSEETALRDLVEWQAMASERRGECSENAHWARGQEIKREYNMKIR